MTLHKMKPIVDRSWLFIVAGLMWTAVGLMLLWRAFGWLLAASHTMPLFLLGMGIALLSYHFMFTNTVRKNIARLHTLPERTGLLAFNSARGYGIIVIMIALGIGLRHSSLDRSLLAVLYTAMGGALFLASFHFYGQVWPQHTQPALTKAIRSPDET